MRLDYSHQPLGLGEFPWKSNQPPFLVRLVSEFHHYLSRGENHHPKGVSPFLIWWQRLPGILWPESK